ncbi:hypothetical protein [Streptomyces soliscabiei]|uniref:hypothetical protein n=1 Tax=Streptomyces soliscabiei TaxID=588897 RepID=UPI0029A58351|nr:hypothetical protein [Streptomyces sp. NY05-11A]MDX2681608.1 hypothetical protein [Streptomyces sp. NY05-11A]
MLAGRRVLVVLDNARDTEQVRPLLPGSPGCLAIVTSRDALSGLVAGHGAHPLTLRPFDTGQARAFLVRGLGADRVAAEPGAADEIGELCAGLPLALACVAARAVVHPHFPLAAVAAELREAHGSLDAFARSDASVDVGTVFSWSSRAVSTAAARLFALHPAPTSLSRPRPPWRACPRLPARRAAVAAAVRPGPHRGRGRAPGRRDARLERREPAGDPHRRAVGHGHGNGRGRGAGHAGHAGRAVTAAGTGHGVRRTAPERPGSLPGGHRPRPSHLRALSAQAVQGGGHHGGPGSCAGGWRSADAT